MGYIDWWNRTGPITMGERFGLNEISTRAKPLSPTKSYAKKPPYNWEQGNWMDPSDSSVGNTGILENFDISTATMHKEGGRIGLKEGTTKLGSLIIDFIVKNRRQPKPSEILQLKEQIRVASEVKTKPIKEVKTKSNKAWDVTKKVGKYGIVRPIAGITLPVVKAGESVVETVKAVKEKRLPDYNFTDPNTWVNAAFWNWAVKEWGFDKTVKNFGESLKHLSKGDKARVFRNVVARAGLSPKALQVIGSRVAWPVAGAMSIWDAYKDYKRTDAAIKKRREEDPEGMKKSEEKIREWINTDPSFKGGMFAKGGRIGVKKK